MKSFADIHAEASELVKAKSVVIALTTAELKSVVAATVDVIGVLPDEDHAKKAHAEFTLFATYAQPAPMKLNASKVLALTNLVVRT